MLRAYPKNVMLNPSLRSRVNSVKHLRATRFFATLRMTWTFRIGSKSDNARISKQKSYVPLLDTGHPSESGARATKGITYHQGKFGLGVLADSPGELVAVPIKKRVAEDGSNIDKWRWDQGTIEMWLSTQFDMEEVPDFAGLLTMQYEPFAVGFSGSLLIIYTKTRQIAFLMKH